MDNAISVSARFARQAHSYSVWARNMAKLHPQAKQFYLAAAKRCKVQAKAHLKDARRWRDAA